MGEVWEWKRWWSLQARRQGREGGMAAMMSSTHPVEAPRERPVDDSVRSVAQTDPT